jgi:hypothetical protein
MQAMHKSRYFFGFCTLLFSLVVLVVSETAAYANTNKIDCNGGQLGCLSGSETNIQKDIMNQESLFQLEPIKGKSLNSPMCVAYARKTKNDAQLDAVVEDLRSGQMVTRMMYEALPFSQVYERSNLEIDYDAISEADLKKCELSQVPLPAATWLLISALIGFIGLSNRR